MYKNQLQELAQKSCFNLPSYSCIREGPDHVPRFKATVNFNGETFESLSFYSSLRQAEHAAAEIALNTLAKRGPSRALAAKVLDETGVYKNLLQETAHRAGLNLPVYTTVRYGSSHVPVFASKVELAGMSFTGEPARTKKQAEKQAAMVAWSALKRLSQHGSSSTGPSTSATVGDEEREQVIIARVIASLQPTESNLSLQTACQHGQSKIPWEMTLQTPSFYPTQNWEYPCFLPGLTMYQGYQQEQFLQMQNCLLTVPVSPVQSPTPSILTYMQSIVYPDNNFFVPPRESNSLVTRHRLIGPASGHSLHSASHHATSPTRPTTRSTVSIQEIHEEQTEELSPSIPGHPNPNQRIEESVHGDDKKQKNLNVQLEVVSRLEVNQTRQSEVNLQRNLHSISRRENFQQQNQHGGSHYPPRGSSYRSFRPPSATAAPVMVKNMRPICSTGHRPQYVPMCTPPHARMETGTPSFSGRPRPGRINFGGVHPNFMAPVVRIRSVSPVCSAPPTRKMASSTEDGSKTAKK